MGLEADALVERRRLKRSRALWRLAAVVACLALVAVSFGEWGTLGTSRIARISIDSVIVDDRDVIDAIDDVAGDNSISAVIVSIDSPGGTVTGAEAIYDALRRTAANKPVVAVMNAVAASGGYAVALGADHIIARRNTITGSIGVIMQAPEFSGLMQKLGVTMNEFKSAPLKGEPGEFHPVSEEARKATQAMVDDAYDWFVGLVAERRNLAPDIARSLADGRVYSGGQAVQKKLIDELGDEATARAWLTNRYGVSANLDVIDVRLHRRVGPFQLPSGSSLGQFFFSALTGKSFESKGLALDGLLAIWHPST